MKLRVALVVVIALFSHIAFSSEHQACRDIGHDYQNYSAKQLRSIAATCTSEAAAQLYYNRAYHNDLLREGETLSDLQVYFSRDLTHHLESYRIYIALIESFAPMWYENVEHRIAFLNAEYDKRSEVTELRLHGYDRLADLKERTFSIQ